MPLSTVVVVGDRFDPIMFKVDQIWEGGMDSGATIIGPIAQVTYASGRCAFELNPNRIDVKVQGEEVMPEELRLVAKRLVDTLEGIRAAVSITGIGLNCDFAFPTSSQTGKEIANQLLTMNTMKKLTEASPQATSASIQYDLGGLSYTVRFEPEAQSGGQNLYVAINGHQNVVPSDSLATKLNQFAAFRDHVEALHGGVRTTLI